MKTMISVLRVFVLIMLLAICWHIAPLYAQPGVGITSDRRVIWLHGMNDKSFWSRGDNYPAAYAKTHRMVSSRPTFDNTGSRSLRSWSDNFTAKLMPIIYGSGGSANNPIYVAHSLGGFVLQYMDLHFFPWNSGMITVGSPLGLTRLSEVPFSAELRNTYNMIFQKVLIGPATAVGKGGWARNFANKKFPLFQSIAQKIISGNARANMRPGSEIDRDGRTKKPKNPLINIWGNEDKPEVYRIMQGVILQAWGGVQAPLPPPFPSLVEIIFLGLFNVDLLGEYLANIFSFAASDEETFLRYIDEGRCRIEGAAFISHLLFWWPTLPSKLYEANHFLRVGLNEAYLRTIGASRSERKCVTSTVPVCELVIDDRDPDTYDASKDSYVPSGYCPWGSNFIRWERRTRCFNKQINEPSDAFITASSQRGDGRNWRGTAVEAKHVNHLEMNGHKEMKDIFDRIWNIEENLPNMSRTDKVRFRIDTR